MTVFRQFHRFRRLHLMAGAALTGLAALSAADAHAESSRWASNPQSSVRLITPYRVVPRGSGALRLGVHFRLAPGWHVYWKNSGDAGFPPAVTFSPESGLARPELLWPAPHRYDLPGGLVAYGYADEVVYPVRTALAGARGDVSAVSAVSDHSADRSARGRGPLPITAVVDYLVCKIDCVPYRYSLSLAQPLGDLEEADPATAALLERFWRAVPRAAEEVPGVTTEARIESSSAGGLRLAVRVAGAVAAPGIPQIFFETHPAFDTGRPTLVSTARAPAAAGESGASEASRAQPGLLFLVPLARRDTRQPLPSRTAFAWTVTGLADHGAPLAVTARREVALVPGAPPAPAGRPQAPALAAAQLSESARLAAWREREPLLAAIGATVAALLALWLWGVLTAPPRPGFAWRREALGFAALAGGLWPLYRLSLLVSHEALAALELALLGTALLAWIRSRAWRRPGTEVQPEFNDRRL